jgi:hydroxymethylbilane synthase
MADMAKIKIGTRGSQLALWQANWVKDTLCANVDNLEVELVTIKTKGDKILDVPLAKVGGKGLFVKEIEDAILSGRVDLAVHSMKDMPAKIPTGLCIGAVPERENPADVLISQNHKKLKDFPNGARIGTSSLRRAAQLLYVRKDLTILPLRGNLDTRMQKLKTENLDAIVLAAAGVNRLGLSAQISEQLDHEVMLPAVGQGALCIEMRENDAKMSELIQTLDDLQTRQVVLGERAFLNRLEGGCQIPVAGHGRIENNEFVFEGLVAETDGSVMIRESHCGPLKDSEKIGIELAEHLLERGADEILANLIETA